MCPRQHLQILSFFIRANTDTVEACREELCEVLEEWIIWSMKERYHIHVIE
jgi:hypothetical protein